MVVAAVQIVVARVNPVAAAPVAHRAATALEHRAAAVAPAAGVPFVGAMARRSAAAAKVDSVRLHVTGVPTPNGERRVLRSRICPRKFRQATLTPPFVATCSASISRTLLPSLVTW